MMTDEELYDTARIRGIGGAVARLLAERDKMRAESAANFVRAREWAERVGALEAELAEWHKLRDPFNLHASLLRGQPAQLTREQRLHLICDDADRIAGIEAENRRLEGERAVLLGLLADCAAVIRIVEVDDADESGALAGLLKHIDRALGSDQEQGDLL